jgi:hypothetical protein
MSLSRSKPSSPTGPSQTTHCDAYAQLFRTPSLAILVLSAWAGVKVGGKAAVYRYRYQQREVERLEPERARLESTLRELGSIERMRLSANLSANDKKLRKTVLPSAIEELENLRRKPDTDQISGVIDLNLAFLYLYSAMAEEQNDNREIAAKDMSSAEPLFKCLGWRDYSDEALKAAAQQVLDQRHPGPQPKSDDK